MLLKMHMQCAYVKLYLHGVKSKLNKKLLLSAGFVLFHLRLWVYLKLLYYGGKTKTPHRYSADGRDYPLSDFQCWLKCWNMYLIEADTYLCREIFNIIVLELNCFVELFFFLKRFSRSIFILIREIILSILIKSV